MRKRNFEKEMQDILNEKIKEDSILEDMSVMDLILQREVVIEEKEDFEDFYLNPEEPLDFG